MTTWLLSLHVKLAGDLAGILLADHIGVKLVLCYGDKIKESSRTILDLFFNAFWQEMEKCDCLLFHLYKY